LSGGGIQAGDGDPGMHDHEITFPGFRNARHVTHASHAVELDFGLRERRLSVEPADHFAGHS